MIHFGEHVGEVIPQFTDLISRADLLQLGKNRLAFLIRRVLPDRDPGLPDRPEDENDQQHQADRRQNDLEQKQESDPPPGIRPDLRQIGFLIKGLIDKGRVSAFQLKDRYVVIYATVRHLHVKIIV